MRDKNPVIIGSRGSELALWQSEWVKTQLARHHPTLCIEVRVIKTKGDKILDAALSKIGDKGLFTKELDVSLLDHSIDLAVHSLKDVPTLVQNGMSLTAICKREDVRDVFISHPRKRYRSLSDVPHGGTIATGSLRRRCLLLELRPDLNIVEIRGNLGTRIDKLADSTWDGIILAKAGIERLGQSAMISEILSPAQFLPAVGQGALAVVTRDGDEELGALVRTLDDSPTHQATLGERALLRKLEGGCQIPIGAYGRIEDGVFRLDAAVGSLDGKRVVRSSIEGLPGESEQLGVSLAETLLNNGADLILDEIRRLAT